MKSQTLPKLAVLLPVPSCTKNILPVVPGVSSAGFATVILPLKVSSKFAFLSKSNMCVPAGRVTAAISTDTLLSKFVFCQPPTVAISAVPVPFGAVSVFGISKFVPLSRTIFVVDTLALVLVS